MRLATRADLDAIAALMRASAEALSAGFYDAQQIASVVAHVAQLDTQLVDDGTYFVVDDGGLVACGGWSWRDKLYTGTDASGTARRLDPASEPARVRAMFVHPRAARRGLGRAILDASETAARAAGFSRVELLATLPGEPLYAACGYDVLERVTIALPDGIGIGGARMGKSIR